MKTINFLKSTLVATLAVTLSLGFASCSNDDNDGFDPENPNVTLLPTKITDKQEGEIFTFEYNDKNQLTQLKRTTISKPGEYTVTTFAYGDDGTIRETNEKEYYTYNGSEKLEYDYNATYTYAKDVITITEREANSSRSAIRKVFINAAGYPTTTKQDEDDYDYTDYTSYDKYGNLTGWTGIEKDMLPATGNNKGYNYIVSEVKAEITFGTVYSPFIKVNMPAWFLLTNQFYISLNSEGTKHLPTSGKYIETTTTTQLNEVGVPIGKPVVTIDGPDEGTYTVTKEQNNYPTEIKSTSSEYNNIITIEYKEVK